MKVLYEISILGLGYFENRSRAGIFRTIEELLCELSKLPDLEIRYTSLHGLFEANLCQGYFKEFYPERLQDLIDPYDTRIASLYLAILEGIHRSTSRDILAKASRRLRAAFLDLISYWSQSRIVIEDSFDIFHSFFHPFPKIDTVLAKQRVITIYDMIPILMPEFWDNPKKTYKNFYDIIRSVDSKKDWVICISKNTKRDFCEITHFPEDRVFVTYLAASNNFYPEKDKQKIEATKEKYGIPSSDYILGLSTLEPRKNCKLLIRAFSKLVSEFQIELNLVLAGAKGWLYGDIFETARGFHGITEKIIFPGYIEDHDLACIYSGACVFVYPSLYEGFGLPPLEAMQCGVPVITSNNSSLPEVVGDAAIKIDPKSEEELCQAMLKVISSSDLQAELREKSIEQARKFSWSRCAKETLSVYENIC